MGRLDEKMKTLAGGAQGFLTKLEGLIDQKIADSQQQQAAIITQVSGSLAKVDEVTTTAKAAADALDGAIGQFTNE